MNNFQDHLPILPDLIDLLKDSFKEEEYPKIIIPFITLKKFDIILKYSKNEVIKNYNKYKDFMSNLDIILKNFAIDDEGQSIGFYNFSKYDLDSLVKFPEDFEKNLLNYIDSFSPEVCEILDYFEIKKYIRKLSDSNILIAFIRRFSSNDVNLHFELLSNKEIEDLFEGLICKYSKGKGGYFTPNDVINLLVELIFIKDNLKDNNLIKKIHDPVCGDGKLLTSCLRFLKSLNHSNEVPLYGQETNKELCAISKVNILLNREISENINGKSDTLNEDRFSNEKFDYMISNLSSIDTKGHSKEKSSTNKQLLLLQKMTSKMKIHEKSKIVALASDASLYSDNVNYIDFKIRKSIIENDHLESIIYLPKNLFFNGDNPCIWILTNEKPLDMKGKVQFIDAFKEFSKLNKKIFNKENILYKKNREKILEYYNSFENSKKVKIIKNNDLKSNSYDLRIENLDFNENKEKQPKLKQDKSKNDLTKSSNDSKPTKSTPKKSTLANLIYPFLISYLTVKRGSSETSQKLHNYFILYEFITAFNTIVLLSALPKKYGKKKDEILKNFKYNVLPFGSWVGLCRRLSNLFKDDNSNLPLGINFYKKISNKYFLKTVNEVLELRNKTVHGGITEPKKSEYLLKKIDEYEKELIKIFIYYRNLELLYIDKVVNLEKDENIYSIVKLNGRNAGIPLLYQEFSSKKRLKRHFLYLFDPKTKKILELKNNLIKFEYCPECGHWAVYIYNSFKKATAIYKSFQNEQHDYKDDNIKYSDIFK